MSGLSLCRPLLFLSRVPVSAEGSTSVQDPSVAFLFGEWL